MKKYQRIFSVAIVFSLLSLCCNAQKSKNKKAVKNKNQSTSIVVAPGELNLACPGKFPSILFANNDSKFTDKAKAILKGIAKTIKQKPEAVLHVNLISQSTKSGQRNCFQRIQHIISFLAEKEGISFDRINTNCDLLETFNPSKADIERTNTAEFTCE